MELAVLSGTDVFLSIYNVANNKVFEYSTWEDFTTSKLDPSLNSDNIVKFEASMSTAKTGEQIVSHN